MMDIIIDLYDYIYGLHSTQNGNMNEYSTGSMVLYVFPHNDSMNESNSK